MAEKRDALVVFMATLAGAWTVVAGLALPVGLAALVVIGFVGWLMKALARARLRTDPDQAIRLMQGYVLVPFAVVALTTAVMAWVGLNVGDWLALLPDWAIDRSRLTAEGKPSEASKTASALVAGAITSLVALLWSDASSERSSAFWPAGLAKTLFKEAFAPHVAAFPQTEENIGAYTQLYDAVQGDDVSPEVSGWDAAALQGRIKVIRRICPAAFTP